MTALEMFSVSAIIPVYRGRETIARAVDSINQQSVRPIEIIVVDNEPDLELETFLPSSDCPISVLREPRLGAAFARNAGMAAARGTHYAFLDCDDEWTAEYLSAMSRAIRSNPWSSLFAGASLVYTDDGGRYERPPRFGKHALSRLLVYNGIATSGVVVNGAAARSCGGFLEGLSVPAGCEDWALWLNLLRHGEGVAVPDAIVTRHESLANARRVGSQAFYRDLQMAARHGLGEHPSRRLVRAADAGIALRRGTEHLSQGNRREALICTSRALLRYPLSRYGWAWFALALAPRSLGRGARRLRLSIEAIRRYWHRKPHEKR